MRSGERAHPTALVGEDATLNERIVVPARKSHPRARAIPCRRVANLANGGAWMRVPAAGPTPGLGEYLVAVNADAPDIDLELVEVQDDVVNPAIARPDRRVVASTIFSRLLPRRDLPSRGSASRGG